MPRGTPCLAIIVICNFYQFVWCHHIGVVIAEQLGKREFTTGNTPFAVVPVVAPLMPASGALSLQAWLACPHVAVTMRPDMDGEVERALRERHLRLTLPSACRIGAWPPNCCPAQS